jgi:hypothetical protein
MRRQAINNEAEKLLAQFAGTAYDKAREAMREARRRLDLRLGRYFAQVALRIAALTGKVVGLDTATRYLGRR